MTELEYTKVSDLRSVRDALNILSEVIPKMNPSIDKGKFVKAYRILYDIWEQQSQEINLEE